MISYQSLLLSTIVLNDTTNYTTKNQVLRIIQNAVKSDVKTGRI